MCERSSHIRCFRFGCYVFTDFVWSTNFRCLRRLVFSAFLRICRPDSLRYCWSLRGPYLSLHDERYGRKACRVVASSISLVVAVRHQRVHCAAPPFPAKPADAGLWRGPHILRPLQSPDLMTRLSRLRCREANTLGVRFAYSLASACCAAKLTVLRCKFLTQRSTTESDGSSAEHAIGRA